MITEHDVDCPSIAKAMVPAQICTFCELIRKVRAQGQGDE